MNLFKRHRPRIRLTWGGYQRPEGQSSWKCEGGGAYPKIDIDVLTGSPLPPVRGFGQRYSEGAFSPLLPLCHPRASKSFQRCEDLTPVRLPRSTAFWRREGDELAPPINHFLTFS